MGLDAGRLHAQIERVRALAATLEPAFTLLVGCEVDILRDGSLDYSDELLAELDVVVASVHASHRLSAADQTKRVCAAMREPARRHPRPSHRPADRPSREPNPLDIEAGRRDGGARPARCSRSAASRDRLDLSDVHVRLAVEAGARCWRSTPTPTRVAALDYLRFGVMNARRGWAPRRRRQHPRVARAETPRRCS